MNFQQYFFTYAALLFAVGSPVYAGNVEIDNGNYVLETSSDDQMVNITITAGTTGFIGFGISPTGEMSFSDIVIAGWDVTNGTGYLRDSFATGTSPPTLDASQDVTLISAEENSTHTTVVFQRALNTGDDWDDLPIENRSQFIIWALGATDEVLYHGNRRGSISFNLLAA